MDLTSAEQDTPKFKYRISQGLILGLALLVSVIIVTSLSIIWFEGKPILTSMSLDTQTKLGQNISLAMERELEQVQGVSKSIAAAAMNLPADQRLALIPRIIPPMLKSENDVTIIAGGGVWPEPEVFESGVGRNSFFWARNELGALDVIDEYNAPSGPGYHREEWYVPARVFNSATYWSRSYTDPYSLQPMVTCTTPMRNAAGQFAGVTTIDLKLDGVSDVLNHLISGLNAYAFIVDRNNRFIVFPTLGIHLSNARTYSGNAGFEYLRDLVKVYPAFTIIAEHFAGLDSRLFVELLEEKPEYMGLVNRLTEGSYQISEQEAKRLVAYDWLNEKTLSRYPEPLDVFDIPNDILLRGGATAFIYQMPATDWRIVTVFERRAYGAISDVVSQKLIAAVLLSSLLFGGLAFFVLKTCVIDRILHMIKMLRAAVNHDEERVTLAYKNNDELGLLAHWFNYRSEQLEDAISSVKKINQRKSEFLDGVSQELRKPTTSIVGFSRKLIVKVGGDLDEENYQTLLSIQNYSNKMLTLIDDVFEISQLETGHASLKKQWESVNLLLDDACSQMSGKIAEANLMFKTQLLADDMRVYVDRHKVIQALLHLLANALDATDEGKISIRAERTTVNDMDAVSFTVEDTGEGISEEMKPRMHKQLVQDEEYTSQVRGIGLGLYLVREIVHLHEGAIHFDSHFEQGSQFKIILPVNLPEA